MSKKFEDFMQTYSGRNLKYPLDTVGLWEVLGEDPNCDWGGTHYQPRLGVYEGKLRDIIELAVEMSGFWSWGAGGDFRKVEVRTVESGKKLAELNKQKRDLEAQIKELEKEIKNV